MSEQRIFIIVINVQSQDSRQDVTNTVNTCQLLSAEVWHVANSKIRTKAVDKTLKTFINESKSVKIHKKSQISRKHRNGLISWKKANFTENVTAVKSWIRLVPTHNLCLVDRVNFIFNAYTYVTILHEVRTVCLCYSSLWECSTRMLWLNYCM